jgi:FADH2 O2-dependent halogenase
MAVTLVERGSHPRFALGESSTPLAAISLERLARDYDLPDLGALAAYGRWGRELPHVRRGLKRGFTFYSHRRGRAFENDEENDSRLLVAASPDDEIADAHWLRSDVDAHLVARAVEEGVEYIDGCMLESLSGEPGRWELSGSRGGHAVRLPADFVVDASGAGSFLAGQLGIPDAPERSRDDLRTGLVFGHFEGAGSFTDVARGDRAVFNDAPYPEERAAVHHLLEEGWMYVLPFDDGIVSAGFVLDHGHADTAGHLRADPFVAWQRLIGGYPSLRDQFVDARPVGEVRSIPRLQRRALHAAGGGWAMLPHTFCFESPMFSTGIAWSLLSVERLAALLGSPANSKPRDFGLAAYDGLLVTEAAAVRQLVRPAYALREDFDAFSAWTQLYFAAASYSEAWQRLGDQPAPAEWSDTGFLGATDPLLHAAVARARDVLFGGTDTGSPLALIGHLIEERNVAGLCDPRRRRCYPVDVEVLVDRCDLLGLTRDEVLAALPRLRGLAV